MANEYALYKDWCGILLIIYSVLAATFIAERIVAWQRFKARGRALAKRVAGLLENPRREELRAAMGQSNAPLAVALSHVFKHDVQSSPETTLLLLDDGIERVAGIYKKNLAYIAALAATAPFLGLLGTVLGIMKTFAAIAKQGFGGPAIVSHGIAQALQTTVAGLLVAIPCFIAYNLFISSGNDTASDLRMQANRILVALGDL